MRADAVRNAGAILDAARAVVAEHGIEAPMSLIAARAGVAVGTLYRHHPSKEHLVRAVAEDSTRRAVDLLEQALAELDGGTPPAQVLDDTLVAVGRIYATDRAFKLHLGGGEHPGDGALVERGWAAITTLLERCRRAGAVRADITAEDVAATLAATPVDGARRKTFLAIVCRGLRPA